MYSRAGLASVRRLIECHAIWMHRDRRIRESGQARSSPMWGMHGSVFSRRHQRVLKLILNGLFTSTRNQRLMDIARMPLRAVSTRIGPHRGQSLEAAQAMFNGSLKCAGTVARSGSGTGQDLRIEKGLHLRFPHQTPAQPMVLRK